jgi:hypothetical protein
VSAPHDQVRETADELRRALAEAIGIADRLDEQRRFVARIANWREIVKRAHEVLA